MHGKNTIKKNRNKKTVTFIQWARFSRRSCFLISVALFFFSLSLVTLSVHGGKEGKKNNMQTPFSDSSTNYKKETNKREFLSQTTRTFLFITKSENTEKMKHIGETIFKWVSSICLRARKRKKRKKEKKKPTDINTQNTTKGTHPSEVCVLFSTASFIFTSIWDDEYITRVYRVRVMVRCRWWQWQCQTT